MVAHQLDSKQHGEGPVLTHLGMFSSLDVAIPFLKGIPLDHAVAEDEVIPVAGGIRALHTPGHTAGSVCYFLEREGLLFSGDTIFSDYGRVSRSMPFPGTDVVRYKQSLERLTTIDFDILCGGHGSPLVGGASRKFRELLESKPELPTWREFFFERVPNRLRHHLGLRTEDY